MIRPSEQVREYVALPSVQEVAESDQRICVDRAWAVSGCGFHLLADRRGFILRITKVQLNRSAGL